jgi:hypothetical protein
VLLSFIYAKPSTDDAKDHHINCPHEHIDIMKRVRSYLQSLEIRKARKTSRNGTIKVIMGKITA